MKHFKQDWRLIRRALKLIHTFTPNYLLHMILFAAETSLDQYVGIYFGAWIINELTGQRSWTKMAILVATMSVLMFGLVFVSKYSWRRIRVNQIISTAWEESALNAKSFSLDYADMENPAVRDHRSGISENRHRGGLGSLMMSLMFFIRNLFSILFSSILLIDLFTLRTTAQTNGLLAFFNSNWAAALIGLVLLATLLYVSRLAKRTEEGYYEDMQELPRVDRLMRFYMDEYLDDSKAGKDLRIYAQKRFIQASTSHILQDFLRLNKKLSLFSFRIEEHSGLIEAAMQGLVYLLVACRAMAGAFGVGNLVKYVSVVEGFIGNASWAGRSLAYLRANNKQITLYFDYMDRQTKMKKDGLPVDTGITQHTIAFHNVRFCYPGQESNALHGLNLQLNSGERLAVVGRNGSGKSTMIKLLCWLYEPTEGYISLDGVDIRKTDYAQYQALFSVVFQDFRLFSFGLGQNVAASDSYDAKKVLDCLTKAGLGERFASLPKGLETPIYQDFDEDGIEVSGGEAQKIAIARALYKDAPFVILDEPTAALDPIAEHEIYTHFDEIIGEKTAVYISHRLSSCRFCNRIAVFQEGELIQTGSHEELLRETQGAYAKLWEAQAQYYAEQGAQTGAFPPFDSAITATSAC